MQSEQYDPPKLAYSIKEACRSSSLGRSTIYAHIASGKLDARRIGGRTIIPAESLNAFLTGEA
jgi:excisionase family DNA binding protein